MNVIMLGRSAIRAITEALGANHVVALLCDLEQGPGVDVRFFGRHAIVPGGPAALALKTGAALMPPCQYSVAPGSNHIHLAPALPASTSDPNAPLIHPLIDPFNTSIVHPP